MEGGKNTKEGVCTGAINALSLYIAKLQSSKSRSTLLYEHARMFIGKDASPLDFVDDNLGCAESVTRILQKVIDYKVIIGTWTLWDRLKTDTRFISHTNYPQAGDIIISPTGTGNGTIRGHVGIVGQDGAIMSASSSDGIWRSNYTIETWKTRYMGIGGLPVYYFRLI